MRGTSAAIECRIQCEGRARLHHLHGVSAFRQKPDDELGAGSDLRRFRTHGCAEDKAPAPEVPNRKSLRDPAVAPDKCVVAACDAHCTTRFERFVLGYRQRVWMAAVADRTPSVRESSAARKLQIGRLAVRAGLRCNTGHSRIAARRVGPLNEEQDVVLVARICDFRVVGVIAVEHRPDRALRGLCGQPLCQRAIWRDIGEIERQERQSGRGECRVDKALRRRWHRVVTQLAGLVGSLKATLIEGKAKDHHLVPEHGVQMAAHVGQLDHLEEDRR